jgi:hypothetical protein
MNLDLRILALATAMGTDIKTLNVSQGNLSALSTTAKTSLVLAINELVTLNASAARINDALGAGATTVTWSADKIFASIEAAKVAVTNSLVNGAAAALDTLSELAAALNNDPSFAANIATQMGNRVRFDAAQTMSVAQQLQACINIGVGNPDIDLAAAYAAAKA